MLPLCSEQTLNELLSRKEEEWRALRAHRAQLQEAALQDTQSRLREAQGELRRLQEDFVYNLQVLEERDRELERYDAAFAQARGQEEARQAEVSELKIEAAKLKQALAREARRVEELQQQQQMVLQEHRLELERLHSDRNGEIDHHREQYEDLKWRLERKLQELDGELALQRQELLLEFESEMQKREHEFRLQADDMSNVVLSHELKVKLLNKELEALKEAGAKAAECLQRAQTANSELEGKLQRQAWELRDLEAVKDARIKDLEGKLCSVQLTSKKEEETFKRKHEELDRLARERDAVLAAVKDAHTEQQRALEARVLELQAQCEILEVQLRRAEWRQADAVQEKDTIIDQLREDASALKAGWDAQIAQMSKEVIAKDLQVQTLQGQEAKLKAQLARFQQDIERYKQQLSLAVKREQSLERDQVQLGLDWQRRCEDIERDQIQKSESLIQGLTAAREQVAAKLQETERTLREQEVVLKALALERDQALQMLKMHGLPGLEAQVLSKQHGEETSERLPASETQRLREQNASLRDAVAQMRRDMEALSDHILPSAQLAGETSATNQPNPKAGGDTSTPDYVLALEAEIQTLKHKFKALEEQLEDVLDPSKTSSSYADTQPRVQPSAETTGGSVQAGQVCVGLALRKLRDRVHLLNLLVTRLRQKVLQKPLELGSVQRELPHEVDQVHLEVLELRKQVAELGTYLGTARQEGGEPSSKKQPHTMGTTALRTEGLADRGPAQTKDQGEFSMHLRPGAQPPQALSVHRLQRKLKEATRKILSLRLEKEQLIEMGNRLRAERGHPKGKPPLHPPVPTPETQSPGELPQVSSDHSQPLGQLQPRFTTQGRESAKKECFSEHLGRSPPCLARKVGRNAATRGGGAGAAAPIQRQQKISTVTCKSTCQKENRSPKLQKAREFPEEDGHHTQRSSSLASSSLQDTWKLLDLGSSPSGLTSQDDSTPELPAPAADRSAPAKTQAAFAVEGMKMPSQSKAKPATPSRSHLARSKSCPQPPKIRNYNLKD
ncbi:coiled-coil domain-containing protein 57 [Cynocephalus volans]|uniref:coiled-coil domain-containing protein 57 n=1 Tax=Cynocephalus volans TaxID=110931 RepID=UPI002FC85735